MLNAVRLWILLCALLTGAGWILSALHQLNRASYAAVMLFFLGLGMIWVLPRTGGPPLHSARRLAQKLRRRFRRAAPQIFLALAVMALTGGLLYPHSNTDSNGYRIPRVWHWLGAEQWHWIHTADPRMNIVACGFEWLCAPLMLFTRTDRLIFLINWASYLMLPGLIFSVFTRLRVRPRVAWWWMWLLASGWCFVMQAGSDANDSFAAVFALASVDLALRAREKNSVADLWLSLLAAALLTGAKQNNIPLVLPWLAAALPAWRLLLTRPLETMLVGLIGLLVSVIPTTVLNIVHAGNWQGLNNGTEHSLWSAGSPVWKFIGNIFCIPLQNLLPPFFPMAGAWNNLMAHFVHTSFGAHFSRIERFGQLSAGISEGTAGIGLGICLLTAFSLVAARSGKFTVNESFFRNRNNYFLWLRAVPWLALLVFMAQICIFADARMLSAYYALLFPLLLAGPQLEPLVRRRWWHGLALCVMLLAVGVLIVSRSRPLFPAVTLTERLKNAHPQSNFFRRLWLSYACPEFFGQQRIHFRKDLPPEEAVVGYATIGGGAEPGLWLPFGARRVVRVLADDTPEQLRSQGIHYVLVEYLALDAAHLTLEQWLQRYDARLVDQLEFYEDPYRPPGHLYLVCLNPPSAMNAGGSVR